MRIKAFTFGLIVMGMLLITTVIAIGEEEPCEGKYKGGTSPIEEELKEILENHKKWQQSVRKGEKPVKGQKANLCEADLQLAYLRRADLRGANLRRADLRGANLRRADLQGADLRATDLQVADLQEANLQEANLREADLWRADLQEANLQEADLRGAKLQETILEKAYLRVADLRAADLQEADLREADLQLADLRRANLRGAKLQEADLQGANLWRAYLQEANLWRAYLQGANPWEANLRGADLQEAILKKAFLQEANLQEANLQEAILQEAILQEADLQGANLRGVKLWEADFKGANLEGAKLEGANLEGAVLEGANLEGVVISGIKISGGRPKGDYLGELREAFKQAGLRQQEREITYSIKRTERLNAGPIERRLNYVLFEFTCAWGMFPGRPLVLLVWSILFFSIPYMVNVRKRGVTKRAGIWRIWPDDRILKGEGQDTPELVTASGFRAWLIGFYFSILSAFRIGWRDINVGNWIARIQPREYSWRATGWPRTVSGIQSLFSAYLLVLWVLTYFSRPFG